MTSWIKDLGEVLKDDTHIILTREQYESLDAYDSIGQPTNPSVGRVFRTPGRSHYQRTGEPGLVVEVENDPEPGYVLRRGRVVLFIEE